MERGFRESVQEALSNGNLTGALGRFSEAYRTGRAKAYDGYDFEALRREIADRKGAAAGKLDALAAQFKLAVEKLGGTVHRANSPEAVREYVLALAARRGVK